MSSTAALALGVATLLPFGVLHWWVRKRGGTDGPFYRLYRIGFPVCVVTTALALALALAVALPGGLVQGEFLGRVDLLVGVALVAAVGGFAVATAVVVTGDRTGESA
ncbi:hypothetical protein [Haloarchaeobius sp. DYHT-AS-18]|uniref:hypothetical protein n=1 Tax=Haloarchaeobius sp. DYHT-AS-18 TaxID=3446117 RepID=UPI003EBA04A0